MAFLLFFVTASISFLGSIQLGPVNAMVIQTSLQKSAKSAIWLSIGGIIPEFLYASIALQGRAYLEQNPRIITSIEAASIPIFLVIGFLNFRKSKANKLALPTANKGSDFLKGLSLSILNPQLLPFWLLILFSLKPYFSVIEWFEKMAFVLGTGVGALGLLLFFIWLSQRYKSKILDFFKIIPVNYLVGSIFIGLACLQIFRFSKTLF